MPGLRARLAVLVVASALSWGAGSATALAEPPTQAGAVHGKWTAAEPIKITSAVVDGPVTRVTFSGHTTFTGDLTGRTTFTGRGTIDSRTGLIVARIQETFFGSVAHLGRGTLGFTERFRQNATTGALTVDARTVSGTGALDDVHGTIAFVGFSDAQGIGDGTYTGHLSGEADGQD